jgi:hypothetical protein
MTSSREVVAGIGIGGVCGVGKGGMAAGFAGAADED